MYHRADAHKGLSSNRVGRSSMYSVCSVPLLFFCFVPTLHICPNIQWLPVICSPKHPSAYMIYLPKRSLYMIELDPFSMDIFYTSFICFQGRLSVNMSTSCAPNICGFTYAWFHKRCVKIDFIFRLIMLVIIMVTRYSWLLTISDFELVKLNCSL